MSQIVFFVLFATATVFVAADIPEYIHICHRSDPEVEKCILNSIEGMRPQLAAGIPELTVPSLEPLTIPEVEVANGQDATKLRIYGRDIQARGGSNFVVNKFKLDLSRENALTFQVNVSLPKLDLDGDYELNAKLLVLPLNGRGAIHINITNAVADAVVHAQIYKKGNKNYIRFVKCDMMMDLGDFDIALSSLFNGEKTLGEVANKIIKENKRDFANVLNPVIANTVSKVLLDIANKIAKNNPYDELFPM